MKKTRFTETQMVAILMETNGGVNVAEICRKYGISDATYYNLTSKFGGMSALDLKRLKDLEAELSQYKSMYAELACENDAMRVLIEKSYNTTRTDARRGDS